METVERVLGLYRDVYFDFNVKHFHEKLEEEHSIDVSYTWVKGLLQGSGLVAKDKPRGKHRKRREDEPLVGMMLHIDGSKHCWFGDDRYYDLIVILDDANGEIYYAQLVEAESTRTGGGPTGATRPTGRGTLTDPDTVQGRKPPEPAPAGSPAPVPGAQPTPPPASQPRIVLRFAAEKDMLVSGMLASGADLAGKAAVVDVPVGRGHVVMFANNPMWRHQTHGSFSMLFNAILNYDNLGIGRAQARPQAPVRNDEAHNENHQ